MANTVKPYSKRRRSPSRRRACHSLSDFIRHQTSEVRGTARSEDRTSACVPFPSTEGPRARRLDSTRLYRPPAGNAPVAVRSQGRTRAHTQATQATQAPRPSRPMRSRPRAGRLGRGRSARRLGRDGGDSLSLTYLT
eukprot:7387844-Prymnesium_polylepis.1